MRINHNIPALNAHRMLNRNADVSTIVLERLSSGKRINRAADDAAGMAISEKMKSQVNGLKKASKNALDGVSLIQTAEGALNEVHAILQRMRELSVQAANETYNDEDREAIQTEVEQLLQEIEKIADRTQFNGKPICVSEDETNDEEDEYIGLKLQLQIGAGEGETMEIKLIDIKKATECIMGSESEDEENGENSRLEITDSASASNAIMAIDEAIKNISEGRSRLGATQNRLEHTIANLDNTAENLSTALSRIEDADMALEMSEFTKYNILIQAGTAMLAQANQRPQTVLQLLGG